jgi:hypothetical protein
MISIIKHISSLVNKRQQNVVARAKSDSSVVADSRDAGSGESARAGEALTSFLRDVFSPFTHPQHVKPISP